MRSIATLLLLTSFAIQPLVAQVTVASDVATATESAEKGDSSPKEKEAKKKPVEVAFGKGKFILPVPGDWVQGKPRNRLVEVEFSVPPTKKGAMAGRFTVVQSGGTIKRNVGRWIGQFKNHKKPEKDEVGAVTKYTVDGMAAHVVDISGDFMDAPRGPTGPKVQRKDYRMVAAILETKNSGRQFFKLVGPQDLIKNHAPAFVQMIKGIRAKK